MQIRFFLDGIEFNEIDGLDEYKYKIEWMEGKTAFVAQTPTITVTGFAFDYLQERFFSPSSGNCMPEETEVLVTIVPCRGEEDIYIMRAKDIERYCPDECIIEFVAETNQAESRQLKCLKNNLIWYGAAGDKTNPNFTDGAIVHPRVEYCMKDTYTGPIWAILLAPLTFILTVIGLANAINGCGRRHPSPYVRSYLENACSICGMDFQSTILQQGTYKNTALVAAQHKQGVNNDGINWIEENAPALNTPDLMKLLGPTFNSSWIIENDTVIMEREDELYENAPVLINVEDAFKEGRADKAAVYAWDEEQRYSFGVFEYTKDAIDEAGNDDFSEYRDFVEWNPAQNENRVGKYENIVEFSPAGFVRNNKDLFNRPIGTWILTSGKSQQYKLILLEKDFYQNSEKARAIKSPTGGPNNEHDVNGALTFNEQRTQPELYQNFHFIKDPNSESNCLKLLPFTFAYRGQDIQSIKQNGLRVRVDTPFGFGIPEDIEIDYKNGTITTGEAELKPY